MDYISKKYLLKTYEEARKGDAISFRKIIDEAPVLTLTGDLRGVLAQIFEQMMEEKEPKTYDCSNVIDYVHELHRMCRSNNCDECAFKTLHCIGMDNITPDHITILQQWSDEHPEGGK